MAAQSKLHMLLDHSNIGIVSSNSARALDVRSDLFCVSFTVCAGRSKMSYLNV
jgi:hypothetical protein